MSAADLTAGTAGEIAEYMRVTPRRVRQLAEEGRLRRRGRGHFDVAHALHGAVGRAFLGQDAARGLSGDAMAAVGWLVGFIGKHGAPLTAADLTAWREGCERWGLSEAEASALLIEGAALLGDRAPKFKAGRA